MAFKDKLFLIQTSLAQHNRTPYEVFKECLAERLTQGLTAYTDEMEYYCNYLSSKNSYNMLKRISKEK